ncbi:MAG: restriction endonuclease [Bacilli bacterium]|nr:restriction endonuclease [Bacilli bacterium]
MQDIDIIENFMNSFEFRNYVQSVLIKHNYEPVSMDDDRWSDDDPKNNNDMIAKKGDIKYTVQTFLNKKITTREIEETVEDMKKEKVDYGIIITNGDASQNAKEEAEKRNIRIIDNESFEEYINVK